MCLFQVALVKNVQLQNAGVLQLDCLAFHLANGMQVKSAEIQFQRQIIIFSKTNILYKHYINTFIVIYLNYLYLKKRLLYI